MGNMLVGFISLNFHDKFHEARLNFLLSYVGMFESLYSILEIVSIIVTVSPGRQVRRSERSLESVGGSGPVCQASKQGKCHGLYFVCRCGDPKGNIDHLKPRDRVPSHHNNNPRVCLVLAIFWEWRLVCRCRRGLSSWSCAVLA